jgi:hypothetical protein
MHQYPPPDMHQYRPPSELPLASLHRSLAMPLHSNHSNL